MLAKLEESFPSDLANLATEAGERISALLGVSVPRWLLALSLNTRAALYVALGSESVSSIRRVIENYGTELLDLSIRALSFEKYGIVRPEIISESARQAKACASAWAHTLGLPDSITLSIDEGAQASDSQIIDSTAILAAGVSLKAGFLKLIEVLEPSIRTTIKRPTLPDPDYKSLLQEFSQAKYKDRPIYSVVAESGPEHGKTFQVVVTVGPHQHKASGRSKKEAEAKAARTCAIRLGIPAQRSHSQGRSPSPTLAKHRIPSQQLPRLRDAESILEHRFRNQSLLSAALLHSSWVFENQQRGALLDYRPLAALGASIVKVAAYHHFFSNHDVASVANKIPRSIGHCVSAASLGTSALALRLSKLALLGRGQEREGLSVRSQCDILQACIAAVFLDSGKSLPGVSPPGLVEHFELEVTRTLHTDELEIDAKTKLQEFLQSIGVRPSYRVIKKGGLDHRPSFLAEADVEISSHTFSFSGEGPSRRVAEGDAARRYLLILDGLGVLAVERPTLPELDSEQLRFARTVIKAILTKAARGMLFWSRIEKAGVGFLETLASARPPRLIATLEAIWRIFHYLQLEDGGDEWRLFLQNCARRAAPLSATAKMLRDLHSFLEDLDPGSYASTPTESVLFCQLQLVTAILGSVSSEDGSLVSLQEVESTLTLLKKSRYAKLVYHITETEGLEVDPVLVDVLLSLLEIAYLRGTQRDLDLQLSCDQHRLRAILSRASLGQDSLLIPFSAEWLRSVIMELAPQVEIEASMDRIDLTTSLVRRVGEIGKQYWLRESLQEVLSRSPRDRGLSRRAGQLLHDLKNLLIALENNLLHARRLSGQKYQHLASAEALLAQLRGHAMLALRWVEQPRAMELVPVNLHSTLQATSVRL